MLSFAAGFWPLFWTITGGAALVTVALSLLIATISPAGSRPHRGQPAKLAGPQAGPGYPDRQLAKAA